MKHTEKLVKGYFISKKGNEYRVITDKYSGNDYRVVKIYDECISHILGKSVQRFHRFRYAKKSELADFD